MDRLPVVHHPPGVLAHQVGGDLLDGRGDRPGAPLDDGLAEIRENGEYDDLYEKYFGTAPAE